MSITALLFALVHVKKAIILHDSDDLCINVCSVSVAELYRAILEDRVYVCGHCGTSYVLGGNTECRQNMPKYCMGCGALFENYDQVKA